MADLSRCTLGGTVHIESKVLYGKPNRNSGNRVLGRASQGPSKEYKHKGEWLAVR